MFAWLLIVLLLLLKRFDFFSLFLGEFFELLCFLLLELFLQHCLFSLLVLLVLEVFQEVAVAQQDAVRVACKI